MKQTMRTSSISFFKKHHKNALIQQNTEWSGITKFHSVPWSIGLLAIDFESYEHHL